MNYEDALGVLQALVSALSVKGIGFGRPVLPSHNHVSLACPT